ncbi:hypothetical protein VTO42DRAFT_6036 [Malbranchea cinnamomea]
MMTLVYQNVSHCASRLRPPSSNYFSSLVDGQANGMVLAWIPRTLRSSVYISHLTEEQNIKTPMGVPLSLRPRDSNLRLRPECPDLTSPSCSMTEGSDPTLPVLAYSARPLLLVGHGSFSNVYKISDTRVIKVAILSNCNNSADYADLEARIYTALPPSRHILAFHGTPAPGVLELEYCPHGTVQDYIRGVFNNARTRHPAHPHAQMAQPKAQLTLTSIAAQTVRALTHIHAHNVLHNDLGARQLLLDAHMAVKLADFGSSCFVGQRGMGIPNATHRIPPADDSPVEYSIQADLFALGSTLYEIFSGGWAPYWDRRDQDVRALFERGTWPSLAGLEWEDDAPWAEIILGCWERRFASADEILQVIDGQS